MAGSRRGRRAGFSPAAAARARQIRILLVDVDGVLTDGHIYLQSLPDGEALEMKAFDSQDGAGLKMARAAGLRTGLISGRASAAVTRRAREVGMEFVYQGRAEKIVAYEEFRRATEIADEQVAYIGDDLPDLEVMKRVGLAVAVANAAPEVRAAAHYVTERGGGAGGVREAIERILKAQGTWEKVAAKAKA